MQLQDVYLQLKSMNLCKSKYQFSTEFLGMSKSYYSSVILARNEQPSINVLSTLEYALKWLAALLNSKEHLAVLSVRDKLLWLAEQVRLSINESCKNRVQKVI